ncbi:MAG TPA: hypothetical protein VH298_05090, partial [Jatrophihabitans sp.]|nr:hypothetical protein [Jatrophihabitans sp.]
MPATRARIPAGIGRIGPGLAAVLAWSLIGLGNAVKYGVYTPLAITLVSLGMLLLTVSVVGLRARTRPRMGRFGLLLAALVALCSTILSPAERYARGAAETWSHGLLIAAAIGLLVLAVAPLSLRWMQFGMLGLVAVAGVAGIRATPHPTIDDWHILQGSAKALLHGHNIYGQAWPGSDGHLLPYLPGSAVLLTPSYLLLSDVRYGLLLAMLVAAVLVGRLGGARNRRALLVLSGLIVLQPWVLYLVEQSWPEPLLLALVAGMVWAGLRGKGVLAVLCFAVALATKQHALVLVPLAARWPAFGLRRTIYSVLAAGLFTAFWVMANPHQFGQGAISYNLKLPPRHDSLSLFTTAIRAGHTPSFAVVPVLMLAFLL